ncbi:MAG TPA: 23S rRNA (pseudouridine(1915)-N(3))-methyltransferase RlmH [Acidobacteriaceae bacterium]
MELLLVSIRTRRLPATTPEAEIIGRYTERIQRFLPCTTRTFETEGAMLAEMERTGKRTAPFLILADSRGKLLSSEELAAKLGSVLDSGTQQVILAIGPADGWSPAATGRAGLLLSFGRITLPHELAAVVAAEQVYRALTIRAGHPYHSGH